MAEAANLFDDVPNASEDIHIDGNPPEESVNLFDDVPDAAPPKVAKGLDKKREIQHVPGMDWAGSILAGFNKANPVVGAAKLGQWIGNKGNVALGGPEAHTVSDFVNQAIPNPEGTTANKALQSGGDFAQVVPMIGAGFESYAAKLPEMGSEAYKALPMIKRFGTSLVRGVADNPENVAKYTAANIASGTGAGFMHEATKDQPAYINVPAEIVGGVAGPSAVAAPFKGSAALVKGYYDHIAPFHWAGKLYGNEIGDVLDKFGPTSGAVSNYFKNSAQDYAAKKYDKILPQVADSIQKMGVASQLDEAARLRQVIPGFDPTLAESTGLPSQIANQRSMEGGASGSVLDDFANRKKSSEDAITTFMNGAAPPAANTDLQNVASRRVQSVQEPIEQALGANKAAQESLASTLPDAKAFDVGSQMRGKLEDLRISKQKEMSDLADSLGLNDAKNLRVSRDGLQTAVKSALPSRFAEGTSPTMRTIAKLQDGDTLTFADAKYMMEQLGQEARQAAKQGNMQDARIIGNARGNIDKYLQDEWAPALGIGDKYAQFRKTYLNDYVSRFETGAAKDVGSVGGDNNFRTDNEDVAGKFFRPGDVTAAKDFKTTFGGDPDAMAALHAHVLDDLRQSAVKDGVLDTKAMQKWMTANKDNLAEFPDLQAKVGDIHSMANDLAERQATLTARQEAVGNSQLAKSLGDNNATLDTLISNPNTLNRVVSKATDEEKQALARGVWQKATEEGATDPAAMKQFLTDHADVLEKVLSKDHVNALNDIQKAWDMNANVPAPTGKGAKTVIDAFKNTIGSSPQQIMSRIFAVKSGRIGFEYSIGDMLTRLGLNVNNKQSQAIMMRAMYDADFAKQLANFTKTPNPSAAKIKGMKGYIFNSGISAIQDAAEPEKDNE